MKAILPPGMRWVLINCQGLFSGGGHSLIKVRGSETKLLPRAVQQLKMLPRADRKSHFWHPRADTIPHFDSPRAEK